MQVEYQSSPLSPPECSSAMFQAPLLGGKALRSAETPQITLHELLSATMNIKSQTNEHGQATLKFKYPPRVDLM